MSKETSIPIAKMMRADPDGNYCIRTYVEVKELGYDEKSKLPYVDGRVNAARFAIVKEYATGLLILTTIEEAERVRKLKESRSEKQAGS